MIATSNIVTTKASTVSADSSPERGKWTIFAIRRGMSATAPPGFLGVEVGSRSVSGKVSEWPARLAFTRLYHNAGWLEPNSAGRRVYRARLWAGLPIRRERPALGLRPHRDADRRVVEIAPPLL